MSFLLKWLIVTVAILATPYVIPGVSVDSFGAAVAAAAVLGLLNLFLRPLLLIFTLPLTILTLGFFILIVNAMCFHFMAALVSGIAVEGFGSSMLASLFVSFVSWISNMGLKKEEGRTRIVVHQTRGPGYVKDVTPRD